jgi:citrate lyase subunit beta/citryl-CoA lyase
MSIRGIHPNRALFGGEPSFPVLPAAEHFCGSERFMLKALSLQAEMGPVFDITCDCEDGAPAGEERMHAEMIVRVLNSDANRFQRAGVRIHDFGHPHWRADVDILVAGAGDRLSHLTIPKATSAQQVEKMIEFVESAVIRCGIKREIPIHALIETHGALREVDRIAQLPWLNVLDFGLMDFVSGHHGAISACAMRSPGQFEHRLIARAKTEVVAAALAHGVVPAHNVTLGLTDVARVASDARRAREEFGFLRMWSIHPAQIRPIVEAFTPDLGEVNDAVAILGAAQDAGWGPIQHAGSLYDRASYRYYWDLLRRAHVTGVSLPQAATARFFS